MSRDVINRTRYRAESIARALGPADVIHAEWHRSRCHHVETLKRFAFTSLTPLYPLISNSYCTNFQNLDDIVSPSRNYYLVPPKHMYKRWKLYRRRQAARYVKIFILHTGTEDKNTQYNKYRVMYLHLVARHSAYSVAPAFLFISDHRIFYILN